jgi:hypothetical protein
MMPMSEQCAAAVLLVRPAAFGFNTETAETNRLQSAAPIEAAFAAARARAEFDGLAAALRSEGVGVCVAEDTPAPAKPDAVFPNNWVSFHRDGTLVLYPMQAPSRRRERRAEIVQAACAAHGFAVTRTIDLTHHEAHGRFLEGTGSLVLDHVHRVAYACRSARTHDAVVGEWCAAMGYVPEVFDACDRAGVPLYHTNVMLAIGERHAIVGGDCIAASDRGRVLERLAASGREVIAITQEEVAHFAGNVLELASWDESLGDCRVVVMSASAREGLEPAHFEALAASTDNLVAIPVPTIEQLGGGSVRCMIAEVFAS